ncbi:MAG: L-histidine N(alpha)-methyltransferase [Acidobacteriia bacterium]|nr:L-histidine N(alpha)-methyltransferase [Terriglobia bacterium]
MYTQTIPADSQTDFAADVRVGLSKPGQKELPSKYLYDEVGSALFEVISALPEYGLTRADERLLRRHADAMVNRLSLPALVTELGSGSGKKTRWILEALSRRQATAYYPIEISPSALARCRQELSQINAVSIVGVERPYLDGLLEVAARRGPAEHLLVLFLGSTIGNFDREPGLQFLKQIRGILTPGDGLLLGTDLEKPSPQLILAYDDPLGVTAAFNLNLLARINRELDANFILAQFQHEARYLAAHQRIEMHLRSRVPQTVAIPRANFEVRFEADETIWTESCHKYTTDDVLSMAGRCGFECEGQWVDTEWPFAESLFVAR